MKSKRILSLILALLMLFSVLPFSALAEDDGLEETESVSEDDAFASSDPFEGLTDETQSADDPPEDENRAEDEAPEPADNDLPDEGSNFDEDSGFDEDSQNTDGDWVEDGFQQPDLQTTDESEDEIESYEGTDGETEFSEGPDDPPADDEQEETGESDGGEESDALDDSEEMQESNFSLDDLVLTEYDGSYIWYAIESSGHAYVKTKQAAPVFRDSGMNPAAVLCTLPDGEILLAKDYDDRSGTNAVFVTVVTPETDVVEGFVRESDLSKTVVTDDEIDLLTVERDYLMIDVNCTTCPALVSAASFYGADSEIDTDGEASEDYDTDPDDTGEESDENGEVSETWETEEPDPETDESADDAGLETITLDPEILQIQAVEPIRLMGTRSYTYTIYADHDPTVPISTRPMAYMAGNRQGFTTIDQGNDGSDFRSIHESYNIKGQTVTVLGFSRYHHAVITCEWYDSSAGITRRLLTEAAYMRPVEKTYTCTVRDSAGNNVPNHEVRVLDGKGNYVTTVMSDANGVARYTGLHLEVSDMLAFAEANYYENGANTLIEDNDCATFVSECLTAGGFAVYGAYASNSEANEGQIGYGLYDRLTSWIGVPGTSYPSISSLSPGDTVFMMPQNNANYPYGHSMIIGQVDYASGQVLVYGHSSANKQEGDSNKMWISVSRIAYVAFTSMYNYTFDYSFSTPTPVPTTPPTQPPTQPPTAPPTSAPTPTPAPAKGKIKIIKTDAVYGTPLAGVVFDISLNGTIVGSMTTDASGTAVSGELPPGKYDVTERSVPTGYTGIPFWTECQVPSGSTIEVKATNQPIQFRVKIIKTDGLTGSPLPGAEFTITRKSTGTVAATLTTNASGEATSDLLPYGEYTVTESKVPATYVDQGYTATVNGTENNKTYELRVSNEPMKGAIRVIKTDALDGTPIAGVVFDIYQGSTKVGSMTTNANGIAESGQLPKGNYTVKEHALPQGYTGSLVSMDCVVKSAETTELKATNQPIQFRVKIVKKDGLTKESLPGAEFTITRKSGLPSHNGTGNGEVVATLTTDANGEALSDLLTWGEYEVKESKVPEHFVDNHFVTAVTCSGNDKVYEIRVENEPTKGWIRLVKTDRLDGTPIAGVVFDILQNGRVVSSMTTGADGVTISEALNKGKYTVKEHANPTGYTNDLVALDCEVYSDVITRLTADNQPIQGSIRIVKRDELTGETLAGAEFTVTRISGLPSHNGSNDGEVVAVIVTDADGIAVTPLLTWGTYKVEETGVPVHYVDNHFTANVIIKDDNLKTYEVPVENEPTKGWIQLVKTDALDRTPITGVQFDIYYNDEYGSGLAATMTTNAEGVAKSIALRKGKYLVKEHADPTGYVTDLVTLDCAVRSDETTNLSCTNTPIQGRIRIIKTDELTKEALAGAEFTITRISGLPSHNGSNDGEVAAVITTDADGIAVTPLLTWGTYKVEETGVPVHYVDNHFSTEVIIDTEDLLTYDVPCENEPTKGWIRLTKTDRKNGNPISGVQFDIYYNDQYGEGLATTMTTGSDGVAMSEPIRKGRYIVKEHGATAGYLFEEVTLECTVKSDEITDLTATNRPVGVKLKLFKRDKDEYTGRTSDAPGTRGDAVLTGAVFQVLAGENITDRQGNILYAKGAVVVESLKTAGEEASVTTEELWPGVYETVELTPPTGYQPTETHTIVDATGAARQSTEAVITYEGVVKNEVLYGSYAFVKFCGDNEIHDDAGLVETPEPGAVFQIYLKTAGSYDAARRYERDTITTDQYGKAKTRLLPYGIYTVQQTKAKKGFAIKAPFDIFIRGTENPDSPPSMILNNEAIRYRLKFIKVDAETGKTITAAHTSFKLKDSEGNYVTQTVFYPHREEIDTFTTDETGAVTLPETVNYGLYFAEEFQAPEGYLIETKEHAVFVGDESMDKPGEAYLLEFKIENEAVKGRILLEKKGLQLTGFEEKTDSNGYTYQQPVYEEKYLAGAVFEVHAAEDVIGKDGKLWYHADDLVDTITTTAEGRDASRVLPLGKYYLIETAAPEGYIFSDERYEANLNYVDEHTALVEITVQAGNDYLPSEISLTKEKEDVQVISDGDAIRQVLTVSPGAGFVFGLYNDQDIRFEGGTLLADTLVATGMTDEAGSLTFSGLYPHGKYSIKELSAPDGWKLNPHAFPVLLSPDSADTDNVIRVSLPEPVHDDLIYTNVTLSKTDITGQQTVPGALIEVSDEAGNIIYRAYTDENGEIPDIPVTPGRYTFREILTPEGYELNTAEMSFSVDKDGNVTGDTVIRDDCTRFYLLKLDENGRALPGVEFGLLNENDEILFTAMSDENGVVTFERIPYGTYTVMETRPLPGYISDGSTVEITVDGTYINPTLPLETIVNRKNVVLLKKVDQDGMALPGAEFVLCNEFGERVTTAVSDRNGIVKFTGIPYGNYIIREIIAPKGYLLNREVISLTIDRDFRSSEEPIATVANRLKRLKYIKVDTSGKYLPGVEFALINAATGEEVETATSNENGEFIFTQFDYGVWIIRETEAPEGYTKMADIIVSVDSGWVEPEPFTCVNIPNHYEFVKTDNEGNPLPGVKFTLEDSEGNILRDLFSGEDGIVHVTDLNPGTYIIREIETLEGFTITEESIEVVIDEHYIIPDEMFTLINYPIIQTGAGLEMTPLMWAGAGVVGAAILLGVVFAIRGKGTKKRHRRK